MIVLLNLYLNRILNRPLNQQGPILKGRKKIDRSGGVVWPLDNL